MSLLFKNFVDRLDFNVNPYPKTPYQLKRLVMLDKTREDFTGCVERILAKEAYLELMARIFPPQNSTDDINVRPDYFESKEKRFKSVEEVFKYETYLTGVIADFDAEYSGMEMCFRQ